MHPRTPDGLQYLTSATRYGVPSPSAGKDASLTCLDGADASVRLRASTPTRRHQLQHFRRMHLYCFRTRPFCTDLNHASAALSLSVHLVLQRHTISWRVYHVCPQENRVAAQSS